MSENILTWNVTNWITVLLMAAIGFFLLGTITKFVQGKLGGGTLASAVASGSST